MEKVIPQKLNSKNVFVRVAEIVVEIYENPAINNFNREEKIVLIATTIREWCTVNVKHIWKER